MASGILKWLCVCVDSVRSTTVGHFGHRGFGQFLHVPWRHKLWLHGWSQWVPALQSWCHQLWYSLSPLSPLSPSLCRMCIWCHQLWYSLSPLSPLSPSLCRMCICVWNDCVFVCVCLCELILFVCLFVGWFLSLSVSLNLSVSLSLSISVSFNVSVSPSLYNVLSLSL